MTQRYIFIPCLVLFMIQFSFGQNWSIKTGTVTVVSVADLNTVKGTSQKLDISVNTKSKVVGFSCDANTLDFGNPMIKENFSTYILNTKKYPLITFTGTAAKLDERNKTISMKGIIEMNGQKKKVEVVASWSKTQKEVKLTFSYELLLNDFNIDIPNVLLDTISEKVSVTINAILIEK